MAKQRKLTPEKRPAKTARWEKAFLAAFSKLAVVSYACDAARVNKTTVYHRRNNDPAFAALWDEAREAATDKLEREAERRAAQGLTRKKFTSKGQPVIDPETGEQYAEREYSDTLLIFLLKAARPEKYKDRHEHTGASGGPVILQIIEEVVNAPSQGETPSRPA